MSNLNRFFFKHFPGKYEIVVLDPKKINHANSYVKETGVKVNIFCFIDLNILALQVYKFFLHQILVKG